AANAPNGFYFLYGLLAALIVLSLLGLPCLHAIRKREHLEKADLAGPVPSTPIGASLSPQRPVLRSSADAPKSSLGHTAEGGGEGRGEGRDEPALGSSTTKRGPALE